MSDFATQLEAFLAQHRSLSHDHTQQAYLIERLTDALIEIHNLSVDGFPATLVGNNMQRINQRVIGALKAAGAWPDDEPTPRRPWEKAVKPQRIGSRPIESGLR